MKKNFISIYLLFILICFITPSLAGGKRKIVETKPSFGKHQDKTPGQESGDSAIGVTESYNLDERHELDGAAKLLLASGPESSKVKKYGRTKRVQDLVDNKSGAINVGKDIDRKSALKKIKELGSFHHHCSAKALSELYFEEIDLKDLLKACDSQAERWLSNKVAMLGEFGTLIQKWLKIIENFAGQSMSINTLLNERTTEELRSNYGLKKAVSKTRRRHQNYMQGTEESEDPSLTWSPIESSHRAFHFGDGICVQILESPFDRVEKFFDAVLRNFRQVSYEIFPTSKAIYIFQKLCRKFYQTPENPRNTEIAITDFYLYTNESGRDFFSRHFDKMMEEESRSPKCDWEEVFRRKQIYSAMNLTVEFEESEDFDSDFEVMRTKIDHSIDNLVENCLGKFEKRGATQVFADVESAKMSFIQLIYNKFKLALDKYTLPLDQSVNSVLDMRASDNEIKQKLFKEIELIAQTPNSEYAKLSVDFLSGHFSDIGAGIFRDEIYARQPESEVLGFLSHVFSIEGYKPKSEISSPLLEFYYLYKMSEICHVMPVDETFERTFVNKVASGPKLE